MIEEFTIYQILAILTAVLICLGMLVGLYWVYKDCCKNNVPDKV